MTNAVTKSAMMMSLALSLPVVVIVLWGTYLCYGYRGQSPGPAEPRNRAGQSLVSVVAEV